MIFFSIFGNAQPREVIPRQLVFFFVIDCKTWWQTGKFGAVLASIPLPIFAALYCVLFAYVGMYNLKTKLFQILIASINMIEIKQMTLWTASAGLGLLQFCNLNSFRNKFILGFSIFIGLSVAQYFTEYLFISGRGPVHTRTSAFNVIMQVIFSSAATVGIMAAFLLDCTHSYGHASVRRDSGRHWWEKFRVYHTDTRTEEFYALPYNLNRFFPSFWKSRKPKTRFFQSVRNLHLERYMYNTNNFPPR